MAQYPEAAPQEIIQDFLKCLDSSWTCDVCDGEISRAADGTVEWAKEADSEGAQLHLVHNKESCRYPENLSASGTGMAHYLGPHGLTRLLALHAQNEVPIDQVTELIMRLHVPGFESARFGFEYAINQGDILPESGDSNFPTRSDIVRTLQFMEAEDSEEEPSQDL